MHYDIYTILYNIMNLNSMIKFQVYIKMDVAAFSEENFDPKDWINKALKTSDPTQTKVGPIIVVRRMFFIIHLITFSAS